MQENKWENYFFSIETNNKVAMEKIEDILVYGNPYVSLKVPLQLNFLLKCGIQANILERK